MIAEKRFAFVEERLLGRGLLLQESLDCV